MGLDRSTVLFLTTYHSRWSFFEESVKNLYEAGFTNWFINNTSTNPISQYKGIVKPGIQVVGGDQIRNAFDGRCVNWSMITTDPIYQHIKLFVVVDADTFYGGTTELESLLQATEEEGYSYVGAMRYEDHYLPLSFRNSPIAPFTTTEIANCERKQDIDTWLTPWVSGAYTVFSAATFRRFDISRWPAMMYQLHLENAKRGTFYTQHLNKATYWTQEWIHFGSIAFPWYLVSGELPAHEHVLQGFVPAFPCSFGAMWAQMKHFGQSCPELERLCNTYEHYSKEKCTLAWNALVREAPALKGYEI